MSAYVFESPRALLGAEGTAFGPSGWLAIDQARIDDFAEVTGDHQWIHVDVERARGGPFGGTIAHGYLVMSLVNHFLPELIDVRGFAHGVNIGADRLRFLSPVRSGSLIRARGEIISVNEKSDFIQSVVRVIIEVDDGSEEKRENRSQGPYGSRPARADHGQSPGKAVPTPACVVDTISRYYS